MHSYYRNRKQQRQRELFMDKVSVFLLTVFMSSLVTMAGLGVDPFALNNALNTTTIEDR